MQTSLARRQRRRRAGQRASRGGAVGRFAVILPLLLLGGMFLTSVVAFVGAVDVYATYSRDLEDPRDAAAEHRLQPADGPVRPHRHRPAGGLRLREPPRPEVRRHSERRPRRPRPRPRTRPSGRTPASIPRPCSRPSATPFRAPPRRVHDHPAARPRPAAAAHHEPDGPQDQGDHPVREADPGVSRASKASRTIITNYLNLNFYGNQSYGIAAAAAGYFGVTDLSKLTIAQSVILAALLQAPSAYDLVQNAVEQPNGSLVVPADSHIVQRRNYILEEMRQYNAGRPAARPLHGFGHPGGASPSRWWSIRRFGTSCIAPAIRRAGPRAAGELLCGAGVDAADCEAVDTGGYKVITTLDARMQGTAEKWLKAYVIAPNQGSKQATIDYLAGLGITVNVGPVRLLPDRRAQPFHGQRQRPAQQQHAQRRAHGGRLPDRPGPRLRRQRRLLREARPGSGAARPEPVRPPVRRPVQRLAAAGFVVQADQLHRRAPGQDDDCGVAVHGRRHRLRGRVYAARRGQLRAQARSGCARRSSTR